MRRRNVHMSAAAVQGRSMRSKALPNLHLYQQIDCVLLDGHGR